MHWLVPLLALGYLIGEHVARFSGMDALLARGSTALIRLEQKLNRTTRSTATRLYRGIIVLAFILVPAWLLGQLVTVPGRYMPLITFFIMVALLGRAAHPGRLFVLWERARTGKLPLELPRSDYLFSGYPWRCPPRHRHQQ